MGMYTEIYLNFKINNDAPEVVRAVLESLFNSGDDVDTNSPELSHEFFKCDRWSFIGTSNSYYFTPFPLSLFQDGYVTSRSDLKNYDEEIKKFLDWVSPFIDALDREHIGHFRYEEEAMPTLIFINEENEVYYK